MRAQILLLMLNPLLWSSHMCGQPNGGNTQPQDSIESLFKNFDAGAKAAKGAELVAIDKRRGESKKQFLERIKNAARHHPNFSGSYSIVAWSCGFVCQSMAIVDLNNFQIVILPFEVSDCRFQTGPLLRFELKSNLLLIEGRIEFDSASTDLPCGKYVFEWKQMRMTRVHIKP